MRYPTTRSTLIDRLTSRDDGAWEEFFAAYRPVIRDVGAFKGLGESECDDLAQEVMVRFYRRIGEGFRYDASIARFRTFFNRIVKGCVYDILRKRRARKTLRHRSRTKLSRPTKSWICCFGKSGVISFGGSRWKS